MSRVFTFSSKHWRSNKGLEEPTCSLDNKKRLAALALDQLGHVVVLGDGLILDGACLLYTSDAADE